jgi:hypothetical protein
MSYLSARISVVMLTNTLEPLTTPDSTISSSSSEEALRAELTRAGTGCRTMSAESLGIVAESEIRFGGPYHSLGRARKTAFRIDVRERIIRRRRDRAERELARGVRETRWKEIATGERAPMQIGGWAYEHEYIKTAA